LRRENAPNTKGDHGDQDAQQGTSLPKDERLEHLDPLPISKAVVEGEEVLGVQGAQDDLVREYLQSIRCKLAQCIPELEAS
jgi:hypothetical protein